MKDRELRRIAREFRAGILGEQPSDLMCLAVCAPLQSFLSSLYEFNTKLEEVQFPRSNHFWLRLEDGRILDPTADQFSGDLKLPKVYLGDVPAVYRRWILESQSPRV